MIKSTPATPEKLRDLFDPEKRYEHYYGDPPPRTLSDEKMRELGYVFHPEKGKKGRWIKENPK